MRKSIACLVRTHFFKNGIVHNCNITYELRNDPYGFESITNENTTTNTSDWFKIYFIENDGMAWGTKISDFASFISDRTAKVILTLFRVVAIFGIGYWLYDTTKKQSSKILIIAIALIFSGSSNFLNVAIKPSVSASDKYLGSTLYLFAAAWICDFLVIKLSKNGSVSWLSRVPKSQQTFDIVEKLASFKLLERKH